MTIIEKAEASVNVSGLSGHVSLIECFGKILTQTDDAEPIVTRSVETGLTSQRITPDRFGGVQSLRRSEITLLTDMTAQAAAEAIRTACNGQNGVIRLTVNSLSAEIHCCINCAEPLKRECHRKIMRKT